MSVENFGIKRIYSGDHMDNVTRSSGKMVCILSKTHVVKINNNGGKIIITNVKEETHQEFTWPHGSYQAYCICRIDDERFAIAGQNGRFSIHSSNGSCLVSSDNYLNGQNIFSCSHHEGIIYLAGGSGYYEARYLNNMGSRKFGPFQWNGGVSNIYTIGVGEDSLIYIGGGGNRVTAYQINGSTMEGTVNGLNAGDINEVVRMSSLTYIWATGSGNDNIGRIYPGNFTNHGPMDMQTDSMFKAGLAVGPDGYVYTAHANGMISRINPVTNKVEKESASIGALHSMDIYDGLFALFTVDGLLQVFTWNQAPETPTAKIENVEISKTPETPTEANPRELFVSIQSADPDNDDIQTKVTITKPTGEIVHTTDYATGNIADGGVDNVTWNVSGSSLKTADHILIDKDTGRIAKLNLRKMIPTGTVVSLFIELIEINGSSNLNAAVYNNDSTNGGALTSSLNTPGIYKFDKTTVSPADELWIFFQSNAEEGATAKFRVLALIENAPQDAIITRPYKAFENISKVPIDLLEAPKDYHLKCYAKDTKGDETVSATYYFKTLLRYLIILEEPVTVSKGDILPYTEMVIKHDGVPLNIVTLEPTHVEHTIAGLDTNTVNITIEDNSIDMDRYLHVVNKLEI